MGTETPYFYRVTNCRKVKMADEKPRGRPGKGPKGTGKSGYNRFVKQNMALALAEKKKKGDGQNHFKILGAWWKDLSPEIREKFNKEKDFEHTVFQVRDPGWVLGWLPEWRSVLIFSLCPFSRTFCTAFEKINSLKLVTFCPDIPISFSGIKVC